MIKMLIATLTIMASTHAMAAAIDFTKVPTTQAVVCYGNDTLTQGLGVQLVFTPNKAFDGAKLNLGYLIFDKADTTKIAPYTLATIGRKAVADKAALLALLKGQLGGILEDALIEGIASIEGNYPLSVVIAKGEVKADANSPVVGSAFIMSINGFSLTDDKGNAVEAAFSALYFKPAPKATEAAALWSRSFQSCQLAALTDIFPAATPAKK